MFQRRRRNVSLAIMLCLGASLTASAAAQSVRLDVQANISPEHVLHFEGTVTPRNLIPEGRLQVRNEVDIFVEAVGEDGSFRELPDEYHPGSGEKHLRGELLEAEKLEGVDSTLHAISGEALSPDDEDDHLGITGTVDLEDAARFRIIARLKHTWAGSWPTAECYYDIAGPFDVRPGIARKRRGGGFLGDVGRFLEQAVSDIGDFLISGVEDVGRFLLGGGDNSLALLQQLLIGDLQQRGGALGQAARVIGGGPGAGIALYVLDQVIAGEASLESDDLTRALIDELLDRHVDDDAVSDTLREIAATGLPDGDPDLDGMIAEEMERLEQNLTEHLGLRDVRVDFDEVSAVVASQTPGLEGRGHLEPIVAYMLVDAALSAPWTEEVTALFDDASGATFGISVEAEAARDYARGELDTESFLRRCVFADPAGIVSADAADAGPVEYTHAPGFDEAVTPLLAQSLLPTGWMASATHPVKMADLDVVIPGVPLSDQPAEAAAIQVLQVDDLPITLLGLQMPDEQAAEEFTAMLAETPGGEWHDGFFRLSTDAPLGALHHGRRAYLLQGEDDTLGEVARLLASDIALDTEAGLDALLPAVTADDPPRPEVPADRQPEDEAPEQTTEDVDEADEAIALPEDSFLSDAYLCIDDDGTQPKRLSGALREGSDRVGVYLDIRDAPEESVLALELSRDGTPLGRRLLGVRGNRRTVLYFRPDGGFRAGTWELEISVDDRHLGSLSFEVE